MAADRFRDTIVNEAGEFAAPVSLHGVAYESMIDPAGEPQGDDFVFDDEPSWNQPVAAAPVRPAAKPAGENRKITHSGPSGRNGKRRRGGWRAYGYVLAICLSLAGIFVLGIMMIPQLAGFFWRDFDNFAFINGELLRYGEFDAPVTLEKLAAQAAEALHGPVVPYGGAQRLVTRWAICSGAGGSETAEAAANDAQVLLTGEVKHHEALDAMERGLCVLEAGHFFTEFCAARQLQKHLQERCDALQYNVKVLASDVHPFA